jgi:hypothetical protein
MRLMIVPCAAAVLALYMTVGTPEQALGFGDQTRGSSGFQGQLDEQQGSIGEAGSRNALYRKCRKAVFDKYSTWRMVSGMRRRTLPAKFSIPATDTCVANGGRVV